MNCIRCGRFFSLTERDGLLCLTCYNRCCEEIDHMMNAYRRPPTEEVRAQFASIRAEVEAMDWPEVIDG